MERGSAHRCSVRGPVNPCRGFLFQRVPPRLADGENRLRTPPIAQRAEFRTRREIRRQPVGGDAGAVDAAADGDTSCWHEHCDRRARRSICGCHRDPSRADGCRPDHPAAAVWKLFGSGRDTAGSMARADAAVPLVGKRWPGNRPLTPRTATRWCASRRCPRGRVLRQLHAPPGL